MQRTVLEPGALIDGRFEVESLLGAGGYGEVYRATQLSMRRSVALKVLRTQMANSPESVQRFQNEARFACQLGHPNTVVYHVFGFDEPQGLLYLAMEFLDGEDLDDRIKARGRLTVEETDKILLQMCGSLQEAHDLGLIHRDIKPANVMLTRRAGLEDFVKVIDFGIAKAVDDDVELSHHKGLTDTGIVLGSPHYMAPEQLRPMDRAIDHRIDIYALGCTAFKMLTGVPPFRGRDALEIATRHLLDPVPSIASLGWEGPSAALDAFFQSALSKDPEERPESAMAFYHAFQAAAQSAEAPMVAGNAAPTHVDLKSLKREAPATELSMPAVAGPATERSNTRRTGLLLAVMAAFVLMLGAFGFAGYRVFASPDDTTDSSASPTPAEAGNDGEQGTEAAKAAEVLAEAEAEPKEVEEESQPQEVEEESAPKAVEAEVKPEPNQGESAKAEDTGSAGTKNTVTTKPAAVKKPTPTASRKRPSTTRSPRVRQRMRRPLNG